VRRLALVTLPLLLLVVAGGCRHDGRTLREPTADQNSSISVDTVAVDTDPVFDDPDTTLVPLPTDTLVTLPTAIDEFLVTAPWRDGAAIDARYTCEGLNVAPALSWSAAPSGTVEIALTLTDLDAPGFGHWAIAGLSATSIAIDEDTVPLGAYEAQNGNGALGFTGPCPPAGEPHTYAIVVHYLGQASGLGDGVPVAELITTIDSVELASAEVTGTFSRG
jgi:Raf kinase inhibitor-like YbhB/YbcL family protein